MRIRGRRPGQALVEFAVTLPLLLLLVLGVVEFSRAFQLYGAITDAARQGARTAVVADPTITADSVRMVVNWALNTAGFDSANATKSLVGFRSGRGESTTVTVSYPYELRIIRGLMRWTDAEARITIRGRTTMRNE